MRGRSVAVLVMAVGAWVAPSSAAAQTVRGTVVDSASGRAVGDFTVLLIDAHERSVAAALASEGGRFTLHAPAPGSYQLRVLRIGFRRTESRPFRLETGETVDRQIQIPQIPTALARIRVEGPQRCEGLSNGGEAVATVWEEVRKAVQAVALTGDEKRLVMRVRDYSRDVALDGKSSSHEQSSEREGSSARPYISPTPASIARDGYVRREPDALWYYAPDADVLLSDSFVDTHCFRLQDLAAGGDSSIGVAFEPVRGRSAPDIRGVLRVDRRTAELRELEFEYTALPRAASDRGFGGRVAFQRIPGAGWIIREWRVRAPVLRMVRRPSAADAGLGTSPATSRASVVDSTLTGMHEEGGEVLIARTLAGAAAWARSYTSVSGSVRDSTTRTGVAGASVELRGTPSRVRTGAGGDFRIDSVPPGAYTLAASVRTPSLLSRTATIQVGATAMRVDFELPVTAVAGASAERERQRAASECAALRSARERTIDSTFAVPVSDWTPRGRDSLDVARAVGESAVVLQAIADTMGRIDLRSMRVLKRTSNGAYAAARRAFAGLEPEVDEPVRGCRLRRVILLPYRVR